MEGGGLIINTKFSPGVEVFALSSRSELFGAVDCGFCGKSGTIMGLDGATTRCPKCLGTRQDKAYKQKHRVVRVHIAAIRVTDGGAESGCDIQYMERVYGGEEESHSASELYSSQDEAEAAALAANDKEGWPRDDASV